MSKFAVNKHPFRFTIDGAEASHTLTVWAKVRFAKKGVELFLKEGDVSRSIELDGIANTQRCAGTICVLNNKAAFKHPVVGYTDWTKSRAYIVSRLDKNGFPAECVMYRHEDNVVEKNDSPGGQQKLLQDIKENGPKRLVLLPPSSGPSGHKSTGTRKKRKSPASTLRGSGLRHAIALSGQPITK